jgi:hypothetical protein
MGASLSKFKSEGEEGDGSSSESGTGDIGFRKEYVLSLCSVSIRVFHRARRCQSFGVQRFCSVSQSVRTERTCSYLVFCYDFKRLRQSSTVVGSKVRCSMSLEECKS